MSNLSKIGIGSLLMAASRAIVNLLGFISTVVLARLLIPEDFGLVAIATTLLAVVTAVTSMSVNQALIHFERPTDGHVNTAFTMELIRSIAIACLFAGLSWPATAIFGDARLRDIMLALALSIVISGITNPHRALLQKSLIFKQEFAIEVIGKASGLILAAFVAYFWHSYWSLVLGSVGAQLATVLASYTIVRYRPRFDLSEFRTIWSFSGWMTLSQAINTINWRSDQLFIGKFLSAADVGVYTVGNNLAQLPTREATMPLTNTLFPAFAGLTSEPLRLAHAYTRAQGLVTAVALPVGIGFALVADRLVPLTMGDKWGQSVIVIQMLSSIFALQTIGSLAQPLALAMGKTQILFKRDIQLFFVRLPMILMGLLLGGILGVVIARVVSGLVAIAFNTVIVKSLINQSVSRQLFNSWRSLLAAGLMAVGVLLCSYLMPDATGWFDQLLQVVVLIGAGGIVYIGGGILIWFLAGKPDGAEALALGWFQKGFAKVLSR